MADEQVAEVPAVRAATEEALVWAALKDYVTKCYEVARDRQLAAMEAAGSERQRGRALDGTNLGTVTLRPGEWGATVADRGAFLDWVIDQHPTEYEQTAPKLVVRPAFETRVLADVLKQLAETGEPPELPPGVKLAWKEPGITVTATPEAKRRVAEALRESTSRALGLPA